MKKLFLTQNDSLYFASLKKYLPSTAPVSISAIGNINTLQNKTLAIFSSSKCPGKVILQTYDLMKNISLGGFII